MIEKDQINFFKLFDSLHSVKITIFIKIFLSHF